MILFTFLITLLLVIAIVTIVFGFVVGAGFIEMELRIYQNDDIDVLKPTASDIVPIMDRIIHLDKLINQAVEEG